MTDHQRGLHSKHGPHVGLETHPSDSSVPICCARLFPVKMTSARAYVHVRACLRARVSSNLS